MQLIIFQNNDGSILDLGITMEQIAKELMYPSHKEL